MSKALVHEDVPKTMQAQAVGGKRPLSSLVGNHEYVMERKLDGFRMVTVSHHQEERPTDWDVEIHGYSRARKDQQLRDRCPYIWRELQQQLPPGYTVLDGEISTGDDDFDFVASAMKSLPERCLALQGGIKNLIFIVFDVLWWDGEDVRDWPFWRRRKLLEQHIVAGGINGFVQLSELHSVDDKKILEWQAAGAEGAMIKRLDAPYVSGKRPVDTWLKVKHTADADVVVMGFTAGKGKYEGLIGAIKYGQMKDGVLTYRGQCSGITDEMRQHISEDPAGYFHRVMVVRHMGIQNPQFRHPQFKGFRDDKTREECTWDV